MLVLIVGGKQGSLDPTTRKSVVNSEYQEGCLRGLDCIVFVDKQVWDLLPIYRKNKDIDFAPTVDNPAVFAFIEQIIADTKWVFPFNRTEDILTTLRVQLSTRFSDLLLRSRENRLLIPLAFAAEPEYITRIAVDKGELWEYKLACALLKDRSRKIDERFIELESGFVVRRTKYLPSFDTLNYIQDLLDDMKNTVDAMKQVLLELTNSFGPPGIPGDAEKIKLACDNLYSLFLTLFEWELDVRFVRPHEAFAKLIPKMRGWTKQMRAELKRVATEFDTLVLTPNLSGNHMLTMTFEAPAALQTFTVEFDRMAKDPSVLAAIARAP